jgi:RNA polymerase sigma factor (TIGR02999 family)
MLERRDINITEQLARLADGDGDSLVPEIYEMLCKIARSHVRRLHRGTSLEPACVVNEAWIRLSTSHPEKWTNRHQFFGYASRVMRFVVRDYCRTRGRKKRGAGAIRIEFDTATDARQARDVECDELHNCLDRLTRVDPESARIVEMRFFGGLTVPEVAETLNLSEASVKRRSNTASAWIKAQLAKK